MPARIVEATGTAVPLASSSTPRRVQNSPGLGAMGIAVAAAQMITVATIPTPAGSGRPRRASRSMASPAITRPSGASTSIMTPKVRPI